MSPALGEFTGEKVGFLFCRMGSYTPGARYPGVLSKVRGGNGKPASSLSEAALSSGWS